MGKTPGGGPKSTGTEVVEEIAKEEALERAKPVKPTAPDPKTRSAIIPLPTAAARTASPGRPDTGG